MSPNGCFEMPQGREGNDINFFNYYCDASKGHNPSYVIVVL